MKLAASLALILAIIFILFLSFHSAYYMHLYPDVFVFYDRAKYFWQHGNLTQLGHNEYQPGALVFFMALSPVLFLENTLESFKTALFSANLFFILSLGFLFYKMKKTEGIFLLALFLSLLGPILLFRFDLLVITLIVLFFYLWEKNLKFPAIIILAFATIAKVYPIIFIPYLLFLEFQNEKSNSVLKKALSFLYPGYLYLASLIIMLLGYSLIFQISLSETYASYNFHNLKSVGTESLWATFIYLGNLLTQTPLPRVEGAYGINAIDRNTLPLPIYFFNYFWIAPFIVLHLIYFFKNFRKKNPSIDYEFILLIMLTFLTFSKVLSNQYLAWFLCMLPLIKSSVLTKPKWIITIFILAVSVIMHTYIFPLEYSAWLDLFNGNNQDPFLFWIGVISNLMLVVILFKLTYEVIARKDHQ